VSAFPVLKPTDDHPEVARPLEVGGKGRADERLDPEHAKQVVRRDRRLQLLRGPEAAGVVHALIGVERRDVDLR
jgi:hypothetical protein